jgi:uncharacterized protein (TIGR03067 family)
MNRYVIAALAACLLSAAEAPKDGMDKLEGRWFGGVWTCNGDWALVVNVKNPVSVLEIGDRTATLRTRSLGTEHWSYTLDTTKTPKTIDLTVIEGPDKGKIQRGIYEIRANRHGGFYLYFCVARPGKDYPGEFVDEPDRGLYFHSFARYPVAQ